MESRCILSKPANRHTVADWCFLSTCSSSSATLLKLLKQASHLAPPANMKHNSIAQHSTNSTLFYIIVQSAIQHCKKIYYNILTMFRTFLRMCIRSVYSSALPQAPLAIIDSLSSKFPNSGYSNVDTTSIETPFAITANRIQASGIIYPPPYACT